MYIFNSNNTTTNNNNDNKTNVIIILHMIYSCLYTRYPGMLLAPRFTN